MFVKNKFSSRKNFLLLIQIFFGQGTVLCPDSLDSDRESSPVLSYENAVAQELRAHGFELYYFNSKKQGELDFVIEYKGEVLPIEVKSGKGYSRHRALDNVMKNESYDIKQAIVFCNENIHVKDQIFYCPIYLSGMLKKQLIEGDFIYRIDLSELQ